MTHKSAILGASGYTGAELVRLIANHPVMTIAALSGNSKAGMTMAQVYPHLRHLDLPALTMISEVDFSDIDLERIVIDLKAAVSGAGRALRENLLHAELSENLQSYAVGGTHRHLGEFDQEFSQIAGRDVSVQFTPHLIPANRGILATVYVDGNADNIYKTLVNAYALEPFVIVMPKGEVPAIKHVRASNFCHIGVVADRIEGRAIIIVTLDNLTKGSSGQALQNANLMLGLDETTGLMMVPVYP